MFFPRPHVTIKLKEFVFMAILATLVNDIETFLKVIRYETFSMRKLNMNAVLEVLLKQLELVFRGRILATIAQSQFVVTLHSHFSVSHV